MDAEDFRAASVAAERIFFSAEDRTERAEAVLAKSWALKHLGEYDAALDNLRRVNMRNLPHKLEYRLLHERVILHYLNESWSDAQSELQRLNHFVENEDWRNYSAYLGILSLVEQQRWDEAREETSKYFETIGIDKHPEHIFGENHPEMKDPERAALWSTFIPGSGHVYGGNTLEGMGSAALQLTSLAWGAYNVIHGFYATALITGGGLFQAFYFGGIERAETITENANREAIKTYNAKVTERLMETIEPYLNKKRRTPERSPFEYQED